MDHRLAHRSHFLIDIKCDSEWYIQAAVVNARRHVALQEAYASAVAAMAGADSTGASQPAAAATAAAATSKPIQVSGGTWP